MKTSVMTVTGPISTDQLGVTLMHEHFTFGYPGWYADDSLAPYDREAAEAVCLKVLKDLKEVGVKTVVDATAADVGGRDPVLLRSLSEKSGINIIAVTGIFPEAIGGSAYYRIYRSGMGGCDLEKDFYELFAREITVGIGKSGVKAGVIKVATGDPAISEYEEKVLRAAVRASKETGVPIITHTEGATVGPVQQDLFLKLGANPKGIMIGHQNNSVDLAYPLSELQRPGFYIAFDRTNPLESPKAEDNAISLVKQGHADRIILSHDCILVWLGRPITHPASWAEWNPLYLHRRMIPKMKAAGVTEEQINTILVSNPRRLFEEA